MKNRHFALTKPRGGMIVTILLLSLFFVACTDLKAESAEEARGATLPVAPQFESFYESAGGRTVLGDPITEAFRVESEGPLLQYFQAIRLAYEEELDQPGTSRVTVYPLGEWAFAGFSDPELVRLTDSAPSRSFPESGLSVGGEFLEFYEAHDGERLLGPPISGQLDEEGVRVQYFRNGRLELYPELPEGERVRLGSLGQAHFDAVMAFNYRRALSIQFVPSINVTSADVFAYVKHPILYAGDQQQLYITVMTPEGRSVSVLKINVLVTYGDKSKRIEQALADGKNKVQLSLDASDVTPGEQVKILVSVLSAGDNALGTDQLSFKTWW